VLLLILGVVGVVLLPRSRQWARLNRLHRLASRNERRARVGAREELDQAVRALERTKLRCLADRCPEDAARVERLLAHVSLIRDRIASGYTVSPANARGLAQAPGVERLEAAARLSETCVALARQGGRDRVLRPGHLREVENAVLELEDRAVLG
jgi:hypothetical protein